MQNNRHFSINIVRGDIYPLTDLDMTLGFQVVEAARFSSQQAHEGGEVVSPKHRLSLNPRIYPWHSFLSVADSTPEPYCGRKDEANEKSQ
jgi:hypothetical protein